MTVTDYIWMWKPSQVLGDTSENGKLCSGMDWGKDAIFFLITSG